MRDEQRHFRRYEELVEPDADAEFIQVVDQLDTLFADYRSIDPPASLQRQIETLAQQRQRERERQADGVTLYSERRWLRQLAQMAAAIIVFGAALMVLVGIFSNRNGSSDRTSQEVVSVPEPTVLPRDGQLLTMDEAQTQVRTFLNEADVELVGYLVDTAAQTPKPGIFFPPYIGAQLFVLTREAESEAADVFVVDADTGEILKAVLPSRAKVEQSGQAVSEAEAMAIAERFARSQFAGFVELTQIEDSVLLEPDGEYLIGAPSPSLSSMPTFVRWRLHDAESGAWLPTFVAVGVDQQTGQVVSYTARRMGADGITPPTIIETQAIQIGMAQMQQQDPGLAGATVERVELATAFVGQQDRFVWIIEIAGAEERAAEHGQTVSGVLIDAVTGDVVTLVSLGESTSMIPGLHSGS
jgi:hypothetical protein